MGELGKLSASKAKDSLVARARKAVRKRAQKTAAAVGVQTDAAAELLEIADRMDAVKEEFERSAAGTAMNALEEAIGGVRKAWSQSWLGYHANVYYENFEVPPVGARFSQEWGLDRGFSDATRGSWVEYTPDEVRAAIFAMAGNPSLDEANVLAKEAGVAFDRDKAEVLSILSNELSKDEDAYLKELRSNAEKIAVLSRNAIIAALRPGGQFMSRDSIAVNQGLLTPPHGLVLAEVAHLRMQSRVCGELGAVARKAGSHLARKSRRQRRSAVVGTNVFIGHGRSLQWKTLKDFVEDRLHLPWEEFNRVPVAGVTNVARLSEMLDSAAIAFLIMTGEDEQADGSVRARENVVHEAGLFQGRLGFSRAVVLLEDGCSAFSNIAGLGYIAFPKGNIGAAFEEIRRVLEREDILDGGS